MKLSTTFTLLFTLLFLTGFAQDTARLKRTPRKLVMPIDQHTQYAQELTADAYLLPDNSLQIYPGDTVYIEITLEGNDIKNIVAVKENVHPEKTLVVIFTQTVEKHKHEMMILDVSNPFKQTLTYKAKMFVLKGNRWIDTDVIPVQGTLHGFETWPNVIVSLGLSGWQFQAQ